jgi:hypothetical protein
MNHSESAINDAITACRTEITQFFAMRAELDEKIIDRRAMLTVLQNTQAQAQRTADAEQVAAEKAKHAEIERLRNERAARQATANDLLGLPDPTEPEPTLADAPH